MIEPKAGVNKRRHDFTIPKGSVRDLDGLVEVLNDRFTRMAEAHEAAAGLRGTIKLGADLDLGGFRIKNMGEPKQDKDATTKGHVDANAALSTISQILQGGDGVGLDPGLLDGGDGIVDASPSDEVRNITLGWINGKKGYRAGWKRPKKNKATVQKYIVSFFNGANWLDVDTGGVAANESQAEKTTTDTYFTQHLNKAKFNIAFATGVDVKVTPVNLVKGALVRGTPKTFGALAALGDDFVTTTDAVNVLDVGTTLLTAQNMAINGDFFFKDAAATDCNAWLKGSAAASTVVTTTNTDDIWWNNTTAHELKWISKNSALLQSFKKRLAKGGDYYAATFLLKTAGSFGSGTISIAFVNSDDSIAVAAAATVNLALLTSSYQLFGCLLQTDGSSDFTAIKFLKFSTATTLSGTNNIIIDKVMVVRGKQPLAYVSRALQYEGNATAPGATEDINTGSQPTVLTTPDLGNPSGVQGSWTTSGQGLRVQIGTL